MLQLWVDVSFGTSEGRGDCQAAGVIKTVLNKVLFLLILLKSLKI